MYHFETARSSIAGTADALVVVEPESEAGADVADSGGSFTRRRIQITLMTTTGLSTVYRSAIVTGAPTP